uniref:DNA mismatch repair protein MLH1 n=1 Tax=Kwoniella dejecticola CBS 10117 TaxID=1296121 RepID=A0A1A6A0B8_9TREE|nr:DNA mismatch repair protein MLH1 [Kwoniella dejecticola CBS 10117]OBR83505.1 DNA mismatch repair protein MLH1 [Kwoniella dejecticola CBS 10117]
MEVDQSGRNDDAEAEAINHEPAGPKPIRKLTKDVINQIAAAEIIHRPSNAIKELLENSLDAGSSSIKITLKDGGLKSIQITDNGHGINKADLPLLCERYATSKIAQFEDLQSLHTYGFRGEALASISYVSHVEVVTKTKNDGCGWKAIYQDGQLIPSKPGAPAEPKPTAANDGTVITAEDLFYNMPLRKRAFKSPSDEYTRVLDVITKYAVHNPHVAWICKKAGTSLPDVSTPVNSNIRANIANLYTPSLANELLEIPLTTLKPEDKLSAKCSGWVSNANSNWARKGGWLLFINSTGYRSDRLVESTKIKKAIDALYTAYLPKGASPWVYLSLEIDPAKIDVNVHPTKSEVHFLNEDEMIDGIIGVVQAALAGANTSRSFSVQTLLPGAQQPSNEKRGESSTSAQPAVRKPAPNYKVRMDPSNRTLDSMVTVIDPSQLSGFAESNTQLLDGNGDSKGKGKGKEKEIPESRCEFDSIQELRQAAKKGGNTDLNEILRRHAFVGIVDTRLCLSLIQHSTKLYLVNHASLADEHFYHIGLRQFGAFHRLRLEPPPSLKDLLNLAAADEVGLKDAGLDVDDVVQDIFDLLMEKKEMIDEYFSLSISDEGQIETLPMLLKGYTPNLDRLPHFLLCLGTQVNWESEKECFATFLRELAFFYSPRPFSDHPCGSQSDVDKDEDGDEAHPSAEEKNHQSWQLEHVLFPSFRRYTEWPKTKMGDFNMVANLPDLFRIFERC